MLIDVKELQFPTFEDFAKMKEINVYDYRITFATELGYLGDVFIGTKNVFYVIAPTLNFSKEFDLTEHQYEAAKQFIAADRMKRITALAGNQ